MKDYSAIIEARQIRANDRSGSGNENVDAEKLQATLEANEVLKLGNPATVQAAMIDAFFKEDPQVTTSFLYRSNEEGGCLMQIFVSNPDKADYLNRVIKHDYSEELGGIIMKVQVVQASAGDIVAMDEPSDTISLSFFEQIKLALKNNPYLVNTRSVYVPLFDVTYNFLEFKSEPVVYQADDISNVKGFVTTLPCELFKAVFDTDKLGAFITTYAG